MKILILIVAILISSCGKQPGPTSTGSSGQSNSVLSDCKPNTAVSNDPQSIDELITYINSLPKPLGTDCFLKNLKRPLYLNATSSTLSAQPADGVKNPRIFIFKGNLIISIVASGAGSQVLEFSEFTTSTRSIKGELALPIMQKVTSADPFVRINNTNKTSCNGCHNNEKFERLVDGVPVYSSTAFKPSSDKNVMIDNMKYELYLCEYNKITSSRCNILTSLLSNGEVRSKSFPSEMVTFLSIFGN